MIKTFLDYDEADDRLIIRTEQDVEPVMDGNKRLMNDAETSWKKPMNHVARIPLAIIEQYRVEKGIDLLKDEAAMKQFLNDPDQRVWRVRGGKC